MEPCSRYAALVLFRVRGQLLTHSKDINHSGDGGIYAELIQNRAFQGNTTMPSNLNAWSSVGGTTLSLKNLTTPLSVYLPTSMNVATTSHSGKVGVKNRLVL